MTGDVRRRIALSLGATGFGLVVTLVIQVAGVPLFLHGFGVGVYGEWLVLSAVPAYLSLSDLGFVGVAGNEMTMRAAVRDRQGAHAAFQTVWATMTSLSLGAGSAAVAAIWLLRPERFLHIHLISSTDAAVTLSLLTVGVLMSMQLGMLEAGFRCAGLFPRGNAGISLVRLGSFAAAAGAAVAGAGPVGAAAAQALTVASGFVALRLVLRRNVPWLTYGFAAFSWPLVRRLGSPAIAFLGFPVGNALMLQGMVLVVSAELGAGAVVVLSVVRIVATGIRQLVNVINHAIWPELSRTIAADELPLARRLHVASLRGAVAVTGVAALVLLVVGQPLIHAWTSSAVAPGSAFFRLMIATVVLDSMWLSSSVVLASVNKHQRAALLYLASSAIAVGLAAGFVPTIGLAAVPLALMTTDVVLTGYVFRASRTVLQQSSREFWRQLVGGRNLAPQPGAIS